MSAVYNYIKIIHGKGRLTMNIRSSAGLRNQYKEVSDLARTTGEPIYITINGAGDGVFMSIEAFERREELLLMRSRVLAAENARIAGAKTRTQAELDERFKKRYGD